MNIFVITGQTATGKTKLALEKARKENADIINFDSRQVYKKLDIVTGKDVEKPEFHKTASSSGFDLGYYLIGGTKVWLYDIVDPKQYFSSFDYTVCAGEVLDILKREGKNAVLAGGTYLYLYHLLYDIDTEHIPPDSELRNNLSSATVEVLQQRLAAIDAQLLNSLNNSEKNNPQRLIRKIEIASFYAGKGERVPLAMGFDYKPGLPIGETVGLAFKDRNRVRQTIEKRVRQRMEKGALEEVKKLLQSGYSLEDPGMRTIGYSELGRFVNGELPLQTAVTLWTTHEVQYTKRQLTFMKKDPHINWEYV